MNTKFETLKQVTTEQVVQKNQMSMISHFHRTLICHHFPAFYCPFEIFLCNECARFPFASFLPG